MQDNPNYDQRPEDDFSDLDRWQSGYQMKTGFAPGPEILPEGAYDFRVTSAELAKTKSQKTIFRLGLIVVGGPHDGTALERASFLDSQEKANRLGGDLFMLGVTDAPKWGSTAKPWSRLLLETCPTLAGRRFRGQRTDRKGDDGKTYCDLYINALLKSEPMPPADPVHASQLATSTEDIPF